MNELEYTIQSLASERIKRFERAMKTHADELRRHSKRTQRVVEKVPFPRPDSWSLRQDFDPYKVRAKSEVYAHALEKSIRNGDYRVLAPATIRVPKLDGKMRDVVSFGIPDEAVSRRTYASLMNKNRALFSSRSYAYRNDLNVFDAIDYVSSEWRQNSRLYIADFDLKDYFGSVDHEFMHRSIHNLGLHVTPREWRLLEAFLLAPQGKVTRHQEPNAARGIPQGTSISLFLANASLTPLDRKLERMNVGFARFSDDILIWSPNYDSVRAAVDLLFSWSEDAKVELSAEKSRGIRIMSRTSSSVAEMDTVASIDFLSHSLSLRSVGVGSKTLRALRRRVEDLIYANLLREPIAGTQSLMRLAGGIDRDYVTLVSQLRRLLYGSLGERDVRKLSQAEYIPRVKLSGKVANHPSVTGVSDWRDFDLWLNRQVWLAIRKREKLLRSDGFGEKCVPWGYSPELLTRASVQSTHGGVVDARLPSASLMAKVVERSTSMHGNRVSERPKDVY